MLFLWVEEASRWNACIPLVHSWQGREGSREVFSGEVRRSVELFPHETGWSSHHLHLAASGPSTEDLSGFCLDSASGERGSEREGREGGKGKRKEKEWYPGCSR